MNNAQHKILIGAAIAIVCALIFPPFHFSYPNGFTINLGYGFIFDPPTSLFVQVYREGSITIGILLIEWAAIALVAGILWFIAKDKA